ncbi:hypothetical protein C6P40_000114 [Pichia californica]|uniref:PIH1 N-terminal domain-containing protein n=1 Tax=Pichia californica TaxID=460514 RepID=A0A9P6WLB6_9ASCO|nr:hypothetical protein C6P40_000114 [[Candida] californica]
MVYIKEEKDVELENLELTPHFVIKTKIFTPFKTYLSGTKFFINVCSNKKIPIKELKDDKGLIINDFNPEIIFLSISNGEWEIPILTSSNIRETIDKKGNKSLLIDCVINDKYIKWCMINEDLKDILIQWCIDAIEFQIGGNFIIDRDSISLPKRICIGGNPNNIQVDLKHLNDTTKELEALSKDMYDGKDETLNLINDTYDDNENENELPSLIPINNNNNNKKNLIIEVNEDLPKSKKINTEIKLNKKIRFEVELIKLEKDKTVLNHKYELQIKSELRNSNDYNLKFDKKNKDLIISNNFIPKSKLNFPLPLDITGDNITSFFIKGDCKLYVFIK